MPGKTLSLNNNNDGDDDDADDDESLERWLMMMMTMMIMMRVWRDGPEVKSTGFSCRGPGFGSQHSHSSSSFRRSDSHF